MASALPCTYSILCTSLSHKCMFVLKAHNGDEFWQNPMFGRHGETNITVTMLIWLECALNLKGRQCWHCGSIKRRKKTKSKLRQQITSEKKVEAPTRSYRWSIPRGKKILDRGGWNSKNVMMKFEECDWLNLPSPTPQRSTSGVIMYA